MNLQPLNDVMEIDMSTETEEKIVSTEASDKQININVNINDDTKPLDSDLDIIETNININIGTNKKEIDFDIGEGGKGERVFTDDVYFKEDVEAAGEYTQIGNFTKGEKEVKTISTKGKTLADFIKLIFNKEIQPNKIEPSVDIIFNAAGSYEVGTDVSPTYISNFNPGSYTYGPATGVTVESWSIVDSLGEQSSVQRGSFNNFIVTDKTDYTIKASAKHTEGTIALTNLGNESGVKIEAGTKSRTSAAVTGYRAFFYGVLDESDGTILTSDIIRSLTNGGNYDSERTFMIKANVVEKPKRFIIAIPNSSMRKGVDKVLLTSGFDIEITSQYVLLDDKINVEGVNGFTSVPYKIYQYQPAKIDVGEIHTITLG